MILHDVQQLYDVAANVGEVVLERGDHRSQGRLEGFELVRQEACRSRGSRTLQRVLGAPQEHAFQPRVFRADRVKDRHLFRRDDDPQMKHREDDAGLARQDGRNDRRHGGIEFSQIPRLDPVLCAEFALAQMGSRSGHLATTKHTKLV